MDAIAQVQGIGHRLRTDTTARSEAKRVVPMFHAPTGDLQPSRMGKPVADRLRASSLPPQRGTAHLLRQ